MNEVRDLGIKPGGRVKVALPAERVCSRPIADLAGLSDVGQSDHIAAGCWTVGVALSGNATGLSRDELAALEPDQVAAHRASASRQLDRCGAHYVIDSAASLEVIVDKIDGRLARGERP